MKEAELRVEQGKILRRGGAAILLCIAVLLAAVLILPSVFVFPETLAERLAFALKADLFIFLWVIFAIQRVSSGRYRSAADNRGSAYAPPSEVIAVKVAFLQNTLEQAFVAVGAHLALAAMAGGAALALIPASVILFALGRATFLRGYPAGAGGRAFGIVCTFVPTIVIYGAALVLLVAG